MTSRRRSLIGLLVGILVHLAPAAAHSNAFLTGINFVHPISFSVKDQNDALAHMKASGVRVIRFGMEDKEDENLDFIRRAYA